MIKEPIATKRMTKYRVICNDCGEEHTFDDDNPPDYANPAENPYLFPDSIQDAGWDAYSAAKGKRENHATDTGMTPPYESHDVDIIVVEK